MRLVQLRVLFKIDRIRHSSSREIFVVFFDGLKIDQFEKPFGSTLLMLLGEDIPLLLEGEMS